MKNYIRTSLILLFAIVLFSCSDDDTDPAVTITVNGKVLIDNGDYFNGDVDGDFTGDGESATRSFFWKNNLRTAEYNADITATSGGTFNMVVEDANGATVLNKSLIGGQEPDSFSGVTSSGTKGTWSVIITLTDFNGDGSFSLSEGD